MWKVHDVCVRLWFMPNYVRVINVCIITSIIIISSSSISERMLANLLQKKQSVSSTPFFIKNGHKIQP